jgi:hypothetical protein
MGGEGSRGGGLMSPIFLDETPVETRLAPLGRPGVAKGVATSPLVDAALLQGSPEGVLQAGSGQRFGSR